MRQWLKTKWETAEEWLPWFIGITATLVLIVGVIVGFLRDDQRAPAGFVAIADSEVPASSIYADESAESLSGKARVGKISGQHAGRSAASSEKGQPVFIIALKAAPSKTEIESRTGIPSQRGRAVIIAPGMLKRPAGQEAKIRFQLFDDVQPVVSLKVNSGLEVNEGMQSGFAEDDPSSRAQLTTDHGMVSGFITYRGREYRIVPDPERGVHYIVEVRRDF